MIWSSFPDDAMWHHSPIRTKKTFFCKILYVFDETGDCLDEKNIQTKFLRDFSHNLGKKVLVH